MLSLVEGGDAIEINNPSRVLRMDPSARELARRREKREENGAAAWKPAEHDRKVSKALEAYAAMTTSAARGAVRDVAQLQKQAQNVACQGSFPRVQ